MSSGGMSTKGWLMVLLLYINYMYTVYDLFVFLYCIRLYNCK